MKEGIKKTGVALPMAWTALTRETGGTAWGWVNPNGDPPWVFRPRGSEQKERGVREGGERPGGSISGD